MNINEIGRYGLEIDRYGLGDLNELGLKDIHLHDDIALLIRLSTVFAKCRHC